MKVKLIITLFSLLFFTDLNAQQDSLKTIRKEGVATYYASKFVGRRTTSGAVYRHEKLTAAHKTLPFGTVVEVCNPRNGKSVQVVINDRGPFGKGLMIDLSQSAARQIGIIGLGIAKVEISYQLPGSK